MLSGVALAVHFGTWIPSVQLGSVATATALVATQPVWQGLIAAGQGESFDAGKGRPMREWVAVSTEDPDEWRRLATEAAAFVGR